MSGRAFFPQKTQKTLNNLFIYRATPCRDSLQNCKGVKKQHGTFQFFLASFASLAEKSSSRF
jgi:hypothetical protein